MKSLFRLVFIVVNHGIPIRKKKVTKSCPRKEMGEAKK